jgi:hypothetical protein
MRRQLGFAAILLCGYVAADYAVARRALPAGQSLPVADYALGWVEAARTAVGRLAGPAAPAGLAGMLPEAPAGWTRRPAGAGDAAALLAPGAPGGEVAPVGGPREGPGLTRAAFTYDRGGARVVIEALRHPDAVFASISGSATRKALEIWAHSQGSARLARVGGLEVIEATRPPGTGARMAVAAVGGQIQLRFVFPESLPVAELAPFLTGLDLAAMNADVVLPDPAITADGRVAFEAAASPAPPPPAAADGGLWGAAAGLFAGLTGGAPEPEVDLADPAAVEPALRAGNVEVAGRAVEAESGAVAAVLEAGAAVPAGAGSDTPDAAPAGIAAASGRGRPGRISLGVGTCGERAGGGKFCAVGD